MNTSQKERVFVDSSVIVAFFSGNKKASELFEKLEDFETYINDIVFSEVVYKLMAMKFEEVEGRFNFWEFKKKVSDFCGFYEVFKNFVDDAEIKVLEVSGDIILEAVKIGRKYSLLPNDALIAATCKVHGIKKIASFDEDFKKVDFLELL